MNDGLLSYVAYGALVMGGVPLQDLPEIRADSEVASIAKPEKKVNPIGWGSALKAIKAYCQGVDALGVHEPLRAN